MGTSTSMAEEQRRLVLHFDVNETIVIEDIAGGDTYEDCLNKILAKNAFVRRSPSSMLWWDGTDIIPNRPPISAKEGMREHPPPLYPGWNWPLGCEPYYKVCKSKSKSFTTHDGAIYKSFLEEMRRHLEFHNDSIGCHRDEMASVDSRLSKDGGKTHFVLPAFFECLYQLEQSQRDYSLVLRTYGTDLPSVAGAIHAFAEGKHPLYPSFVNDKLRLPKENMFRGRYNQCQSFGKNDKSGQSEYHTADNGDTYKMKSSYQLLEWTDEGKDVGNLGHVVAQNDLEILSILEGPSMGGCKESRGNNQHVKVFAIQDDYFTWSQNKYNPAYGKPLWIRHHDSDTDEQLPPLHIIFDDNIKNNPSDSIVSVRYQSCSKEKIFGTLSGEEIQSLQGRYLVRVPTYMPILQRNWFLNQISKCEKNVANNPHIVTSP